MDTTILSSGVYWSLTLNPRFQQNILSAIILHMKQQLYSRALDEMVRGLLNMIEGENI